MHFGVIGFQFESFVVGFNGACGILFALPGEPKIVVAGRQFWALVDGFLEAGHGGIEVILFQRIHALNDKQFGFGKVGAKFVQAIHLVEFLARGRRLALGTEGDAQAVVSTFEIRFQFNGALECCDCAGQVAAGFKLHAEIVLGIWNLWD